MKTSAAALFLLLTGATVGRGQVVTDSLNATLVTGSLAGTSFTVTFSYDSAEVSLLGDSYVTLLSFDFTLLGVPFTRNDIFQGGQVIFHDGVINDVTASFQVRLPPDSPVQNITFGFGGPGVIGYNLQGQYGDGSFTIGDRIVHQGTIASINSIDSSDLLGGQPGIEIQVFSDDEFPVRDQSPVLLIGGRPFFLSYYPGADFNTLTFVLTLDEFASVASGDSALVQYGVSNETWDLGQLDKGILDQ
jgi:hypothetical protein